MAKGVLFVVSTPIGNLEDITARAVKTLKAVSVVACEDTRQSRILMQRWNISTKLMSLHRFTESRKTQAILERLDQGEDVAIVTDAGTPAISDPGHRIVRAALDAGFQVSPIPGPSSITAALSVSGMDCSTFAYLGFIPRKDNQRKSFFEKILKAESTCIFFETPRRILESLKVAVEILGSRRMVLFRELTKIHEEILSGTAQDLLEILTGRDVIKGEIVIVVEGEASTATAIDLDEVVEDLMKEGLSGKRLADEAHQRFGVKKSAAYEKFLALKRSK
ncbi:MAG: 16S rRNA (cytidine(1402)-2'-O)-methyltransferase [Desulfomonile tiedjei]|nr:16S rRNA (cytidine(1402)-2'-O)-methyltransferase [Desulfomonile tiedjei]